MTWRGDGLMEQQISKFAQAQWKEQAEKKKLQFRPEVASDAQDPDI